MLEWAHQDIGIVLKTGFQSYTLIKIENLETMIQGPSKLKKVPMIIMGRHQMILIIDEDQQIMLLIDNLQMVLDLELRYKTSKNLEKIVWVVVGEELITHYKMYIWAVKGAYSGVYKNNHQLIKQHSKLKEDMIRRWIY